MSKPLISELSVGDKVSAPFVVTDISLAPFRSKPGSYLNLTLKDRSGEITARMWDNAEQAAAALQPGQVAMVAGQVGTNLSERYIQAWDVQSASGPGVPDPLGIRNASLGGSPLTVYEQQIPGVVGLNNVGLLVKVWGRVTEVSAGDFHIDDGSHVTDSAPTVGVRVAASDAGIVPPGVGQYVAVTGISGVTEVGGEPIRVVRPRYQSDVALIDVPTAYIYRTDSATADSFKDLLDANKFRTELLTVDDAEDEDFSRYLLIIIGYDTNVGIDWGTPTAVANVVNSGKPIMGVEVGGAVFFGELSLNFGYPNVSYVTGTEMVATDPGSAVYHQPYQITIPPDDTLTISTNASGRYGYAPMNPIPPAVEELGNRVYQPTSVMLGVEESRYLFWPFRDRPDLLTDEGRNLLINSAWYAIQ